MSRISRKSLSSHGCFQRYERARQTNEIAVLDEIFWSSRIRCAMGLAETLMAATRSSRSAEPPGDGRGAAPAPADRHHHLRAGFRHREREFHASDRAAVAGRARHGHVRRQDGESASAHVSWFDKPA